MKNWLKRQILQLSFWAGLIMIVGAFLFPTHLFIYIGIVFLLTNDSVVENWLKKVSPTLVAWLDQI